MPYKEGQTATGPNGTKIVYRGGAWQSMGGSAPAGDPVIARDPYKQAAEARAQSGESRDDERLALERQRLALEQGKAARDQADVNDKAEKTDRSKRTALESMEKVFHQLTDVAKAARDGWATTGRSGALVRGLPNVMSAGSDAYDLQRLIDTVDAKNAFDALQEMRNNSPTGGALGQVSERELDLLKATVASLDPNQSKEQLMQNIIKAKQTYVGMMSRVDPHFAERFIRHKPAGKSSANRVIDFKDLP